MEFLGVETVIEIKKNSETELKCLQFIINGIISIKKFNLHFDFGKKRNNEILNNEKEYEKFKENLKKKLSKDYSFPLNKIIVILPQKESLHIQVIFQTQDFIYLNKEKFKNDKEFKELQNLKDIKEEVIMGAVKLNRNLLDPKGNISGWFNEQKGGIFYDPPFGWIQIRLNIFDNYDGGDNTWLSWDRDGSGSWLVAYHCVGNDRRNELKDVESLIIKKPFKKNIHVDCPDLCHPGKKVGNGVYCTPFIEIAKEYSFKTEINNVKYKLLLMVRVNPKSIRFCDHLKYEGYIVNGTEDEIRPYRILYKKT